MGNYMSCTTLGKAPGGAGGGKCAKAKVIHPDGGVSQVQLPATAAELMMDAPGHFLVDTRGPAGAGLTVGSRLVALRADEELELGAVYATFPMKRVGTPLAAADVARLAASSSAAAATREARRSAKVANAVVVVGAPPAEVVTVAKDAPCSRLRLEDMVDDAAAVEIDELKHRASNARSRRPTLETIEEENYMSSTNTA